MQHGPSSWYSSSGSVRYLRAISTSLPEDDCLLAVSSLVSGLGAWSLRPVRPGAMQIWVRKYPIHGAETRVSGFCPQNSLAGQGGAKWRRSWNCGS